MRVSTVIPVYNRPDLVKRSIQSALQQNVEGHQIIVIDNCSTDSTWNSVSQYGRDYPRRIRCIRNTTNIGPVRNWRRGVSEATGKFCHILFSDDQIHPDFLSECLCRFDAETAFVMAGHCIKNESRIVARSTFQEQETITRAEFLEAGIFWNPKQIQLISPVNSLFRRADLESAIIEEIPNALGIDFASHGAGPDQLVFLNIAKKYSKISCVNKELVEMYAHRGSISVQMRTLDLPREVARSYFVTNEWKEMARRYRSILWLRSLKSQELKDFYRKEFKTSSVGFRILDAFQHSIKTKLKKQLHKSDRIT